MKLNIKAMVDIVFKKLFGSTEHPKVTLAFLNAILEKLGLEHVQTLVVENPYMLSDFQGEKEIVVDILARDEKERNYQIEMQVSSHSGLAQRMVYGFARLFAGQLPKGQDYLSLKRSLSIWILDTPFLQEGWIEAYIMTGTTSRKALYQEGLIVVIDLPAWRKLTHGLRFCQLRINWILKSCRKFFNRMNSRRLLKS